MAPPHHVTDQAQLRGLRSRQPVTCSGAVSDVSDFSLATSPTPLCLSCTPKAYWRWGGVHFPLSATHRGYPCKIHFLFSSWVPRAWANRRLNIWGLSVSWDLESQKIMRSESTASEDCRVLLAENLGVGSDLCQGGAPPHTLRPPGTASDRWAAYALHDHCSPAELTTVRAARTERNGLLPPQPCLPYN